MASNNIVTFVKQGPFMLVQFNTTCDESLPVCKAMCCRMRPFFNVILTEEEILSYEAKNYKGQLVLQSTPNGDCVYLKDNRCSIYETRPENCRNWHCSPKGHEDNPEITKRANGWLLVVGSDEVLNELSSEIK